MTKSLRQIIPLDEGKLRNVALGAAIAGELAAGAYAYPKMKEWSREKVQTSESMPKKLTRDELDVQYKRWRKAFNNGSPKDTTRPGRVRVKRGAEMPYNSSHYLIGLRQGRVAASKTTK